MRVEISLPSVTPKSRAQEQRPQACGQGLLQTGFGTGSVFCPLCLQQYGQECVDIRATRGFVYAAIGGCLMCPPLPSGVRTHA